MNKRLEEKVCKYQWKYQGCPYPICGIIFEPVICPSSFKTCINRISIESKEE